MFTSISKPSAVIIISVSLTAHSPDKYGASCERAATLAETFRLGRSRASLRAKSRKKIVVFQARHWQFFSAYYITSAGGVNLRGRSVNLCRKTDFFLSRLPGRSIGKHINASYTGSKIASFIRWYAKEESLTLDCSKVRRLRARGATRDELESIPTILSR